MMLLQNFLFLQRCLQCGEGFLGFIRDGVSNLNWIGNTNELLSRAAVNESNWYFSEIIAFW